MTNLIVLLDLAKAFDTVSHILLEKLELYGLKGVTLGRFSCLLNRRQQCVVEGCVSKPQLISWWSSTGVNLRPIVVFDI